MAGVDVSTLQIKVVSDGIKDASTALSGLSTSANNAEKRVTKLTDSINKLIGSSNSATASANNLVNALRNVSNASGVTSGNTSALQTVMAQLLGVTSKMATDIEKMANSFSNSNSRINNNTQAIRTNTNAMKDAHAMARGLTGSLGVLWMTYGNMVPLAVGAAIGTAFKGIVSVGADVEHTLEGIRVRGIETVESINAMRDSIMELGKGVYGPREVAKAFEVLVLAGLNANQAMAAIKDALNLATVGGTTIEKAAETLVQVGTALNYDAAAYGRIADVIAMTAAASMSSVESVSESFKAGSVVGKLYGATIVDIGTAFAALSNLGIKGSAAGTALKNFYSQLASGSDKVTLALKQIGLSIDDLKDKQGNFKSLTDVFQILSSHLDTLSEKNQKLAISMLSNERGAKVMVEGLDLIRKKTEDGGNAWEAYAKKIDESWGFTATGAAAMALTIEGQLKSVKNTLETQFLGAFQNIQPQISLIATQLKAVFNSPEFQKGIENIAVALANFGLGLANNIGLIKTTIELFLGFKAVSFVVGLVTGAAEAFLILRNAMLASRAAAIAFQVSLGVVGIALAIAGAAFVKYKLAKDDANDTTKSATNYIDDFNGKLDEEAKRLRTQIDLMKQGKTAAEAETEALRQRQLAMVFSQGQSAVDAATKKVDDLRNSLTPAQQRAYEQAKAQGLDQIAGVLNTRVNQVLAAEKERDKVLAGVKEKYATTIQQQQEVTALAKEQAKIAADQAKGKPRETGDDPFAMKVDKHGISEAKKELDAYVSKMEDLSTAITEQKQLQMSMREYGPNYDKLTKGAREEIAIEYELAQIQERRKNGEAKATDAALEKHLLLEVVKARELKAIEEYNNRIKQGIEAEQDNNRKMETRISKMKEEADAMEAKVAAYGQLKGAAEELQLQQLIEQRDGLAQLDFMSEQVKKLDELIVQYKRYVEAKKNLGGLEQTDKARDAFDKALDPGKLVEFGDGMSKAFGGIGQAIDKAAKSMDQFGRKQKSIDKARKEMEKATKMDSKERTAREAALSAATLKNEVDMYADMASAAKGFFKEKTVAYKVFDAFETGLRLAQIVLTYQEMQAKVNASTVAAQAKNLEGAASVKNATIDTTTTGVQVGNSMTKAGASVMAGVAKAFEQLGVWGFVGAAAIIAFMASMGVHSGGGSGTSVPIHEERQKVQGTGTVLGNESSKSESLSKALDGLKDSYNMGLEYSSRMLMVLRSINDGITGMAAYVAQTSGLRGTKADELAAGVGSSKSFLGFSSSSTELRDSGLVFDNGQTIASIRDMGVGVHGYQDIHKEKSSFWGLSKSSSDERILSELNDGLKRQIALTVTNIADGAMAAADALGLGSAELKSKLENFGVDIGTISLKGLSGDDLEKELQAAFGKLGDQMAEAISPGFAQFQKIGEGGFETLVRLANGVEVAKNSLDNLGVTMINYNDIVNKHGDIATEIIRQSLVLKEAGSQVANFINEMNGSAQDLIDAYKKLIDVRSSLQGMGLGGDVTRSMIRGSGGLDELQSNLNEFMGQFYSDAEKQAIAMYKLRQQFNALGVAMPTTRDGFKSLVAQLMLGNDQSQELAGRVMVLSGAFADATQGMEDSIDDARSALRDAYGKEADSLQNLQEKMQGFSDSLKEFKNSLIMGDMSPLSTSEKYATALAKYNDISLRAQAGDADAISQFQAAANDLLKYSRDVYASGATYMQDFERVLNETAAVQQNAQSQADNATQQLDLLKQQVGKLIDIDDSVKTVAQAILDLQAVMNGMPTTASVDGSHAGGLSYVPFDGYIAELHKGEAVLTAQENKEYQMNYSNYGTANTVALVSEIKSLREEVKQLRADQAQQTSSLIASNYDASERNANTIVEGTKEAAVDAAYLERTKIGLN